MADEKTTKSLMAVLRSAGPAQIDEFLKENPENENSFSDYMRSKFKEKGIKQQEVFTKINISYGYGYKLISGEKKTRQRDLIIEMCLTAGFSLNETQRALKLYQMAELYPKVSRDAVLIIALNQDIREISQVNTLLTEHGFEELYRAKEGLAEEGK